MSSRLRGTTVISTRPSRRVAASETCFTQKRASGCHCANVRRSRRRAARVTLKLQCLHRIPLASPAVAKRLYTSGTVISEWLLIQPPTRRRLPHHQPQVPPQRRLLHHQPQVMPQRRLQVTPQRRLLLPRDADSHPGKQAVRCGSVLAHRASKLTRPVPVLTRPRVTLTRPVPALTRPGAKLTRRNATRARQTPPERHKNAPPARQHDLRTRQQGSMGGSSPIAY